VIKGLHLQAKKTCFSSLPDKYGNPYGILKLEVAERRIIPIYNDHNQTKELLTNKYSNYSLFYADSK